MMHAAPFALLISAALSLALPAALAAQTSSGAPARPLPDTAVAATSAVLSRVDTRRGADPACVITFAYRGYAPETLFWPQETCAMLTARLVRPSDLLAWNLWDRLDDYARARVNRSPDGLVLYVEGTFSAAIYPLDDNGLTYEVWLID